MDLKKVIVFTDLDGTLLDFSTYSFEKAKPAIKFLQSKEVPIIICSSKTRPEIEYYREKIGTTHPFISENGGGIFLPHSYFSSKELEEEGYETEETDTYQLIRLGASYQALREAIENLRKAGFYVRGFGDMTVEEISDVTRLSKKEASMSKERDFDEPFLYNGDEKDVSKMLDYIHTLGFKHTRGRFFHILGNSDKGKAVSILMNLYKKHFGEIVSVALGDNPNDIPMLKAVDYPVLVKEHDSSYNSDVVKSFPQSDSLIKADGIGPEGWNKSILSVPFLMD